MTNYQMLLATSGFDTEVLEIRAREMYCESVPSATIWTHLDWYKLPFATKERWILEETQSLAASASRTTSFAEFISSASSKEKKRVYSNVLKKTSESQKKVVAAAKAASPCSCSALHQAFETAQRSAQRSQPSEGR